MSRSDFSRVTLTLRNDFHGTTVTIRPRGDWAYGRLYLSRDTIRRAARKLCPSPDCRCCESRASGSGLAALGAFYGGGQPGRASRYAYRAEVERILDRKIEGGMP